MTVATGPRGSRLRIVRPAADGFRPAAVVVLVLMSAVLTGGCRQSTAGTTSTATTATTSMAAPTTTRPAPHAATSTTPVSAAGATGADAAVGRLFFDAFAAGDAEGWVSLMAADALVRDGGEQFGLFEPLPPGLGIPDWNNDGVVAVLDVVLQQSAFAVITGNQLAVECSPDGAEIACTVDETDVFYAAAGIPAPTVVQRFTVRDGLISEIGEVDVADPDAAGDAFDSWVEQYAAFEQWVSDTVPDRFEALFTAPCCVGSPDTLNLIPATVDELELLLREWSSGLSR